MDKSTAYGVSESDRPSLSSSDYEAIMTMHSDNQICKSLDDKQTSTVPSFIEENANSHKKASLVICVIALATAVLALNLVLISLGLSIGINSNSAIQSLTTEIKNIQLTLNQTQIVTLRSNSDIQSLTAEIRNVQLQLYQSQIEALKSNSDIQSLTAEMRNAQLQFNQSQMVTLKSNSDIQSFAAEVKNIHLTLNQSQITAIKSISDIEFLKNFVQSLAAEVKNIHLTLNQSQVSARNFKYEIQSIEAQVKNIQLQLNQAQITAIKSTSDIESITDFVNPTQLSLKRSVITFEDLAQQLFVLQADTATQYGILNKTLNSLQDTILEHSNFINKLPLKGTVQHPYKSCGEIPNDRPSGVYWILGNPSNVKVYCNMNRRCCNTTGGWLKVASLDMTDPNQQCPDGYRLHNENTPPFRTCTRKVPHAGCVSTTFPVHGIEYSRVCGRVIGYQYGLANAFQSFSKNPNLTIDDEYLYGFSLTHGQLPRKHLWTFVVALNELDPYGTARCPCINPDTDTRALVPSFVGHDYFCDTGTRSSHQYKLHRDDPLWNGKGCEGSSTCCSFNNPPFFCRQLQLPTTDNIELRGCFLGNENVKNVYLELIDVFIQ